MFEKYNQKVASKPKFFKRVFKSFLYALFIIAFSLLMGIIGYHHYENLSWIDSFLNASMILSGMGQVSPLGTEGGKIFASFYALFSGIIFILSIAIILAPLFHRFMHKFHVGDDETKAEGRRRKAE